MVKNPEFQEPTNPEQDPNAQPNQPEQDPTEPQDDPQPQEQAG